MDDRMRLEALKYSLLMQEKKGLHRPVFPPKIQSPILYFPLQGPSPFATQILVINVTLSDTKSPLTATLLHLSHS